MAMKGSTQRIRYASRGADPKAKIRKNRMPFYRGTPITGSMGLAKTTTVMKMRNLGFGELRFHRPTQWRSACSYAHFPKDHGGGSKWPAFSPLRG